MKKLSLDKIFILMILAIAVGFAGCGSDSSQSASVTATKTVPELAHVEQPAEPQVKAVEVAMTKVVTANTATVNAATANVVAVKAVAANVPTAKTGGDSYSTKRIEFIKKYGQAPKYKDHKNPLAPNTENLTAGGILFRTRCSLCHGNKGLGDGVAGAMLNPPASDLSRVVAMDLATDGFLFWTLNEGGGRLKTAMPSFNIMPEEERWQIVLFLKSEIAKK